MFSTRQEIKATVLWLLLAFLLTCAGFWQAKVAAASDLAVKHRALPPPAKTKHAVRPPPAAFTGDVVQDYIARCEKGMTDQEIGWVLEDYHNAGLDLDPVDFVVDHEVHENAEYPVFRAAQHRWYHEALVDGLRLSPEQSAQAATKLSEFFTEAKEKFLQAVRSDEVDVEPYAAIAIVDFWLHDGSHKNSSWNLCTLTPEQEKITWKHFFEIVDSRKNLGFENRPPFPSNSEQSSTTGDPLFLRSGPVEPESEKNYKCSQILECQYDFPPSSSAVPGIRCPGCI